MEYCRKCLKAILVLVFLLQVQFSLIAQDNGFKIFLVGDAGENAYTGKTLENLGKKLKENSNSAVIFLGDNSYKNDLWGVFPYGFKGFDSSTNTQEKVRSQLNILEGYRGHAYFIPGNHDWWNITDVEKGKKGLRMEESFIEKNLSQNKTIANPENTFMPKDGSAGPDFVDLDNDSIRIIFTDTYRLILTDFKMTQEEDFPLEKAFYSKLDSLIKDAGRKKQQVIITGHHTIFAKGPHSKPLKRPNFFGRIKASNSNFPAYHRMVVKMRNLLERYPGSYYACGHVHSLQYFLPPDSVHYIVSGAGSKTNYVSQSDILKNQPGMGKEYLEWNSQGFFEIDFSSSPEKIFMYYDYGDKVHQIQ